MWTAVMLHVVFKYCLCRSWVAGFLVLKAKMEICMVWIEYLWIKVIFLFCNLIYILLTAIFLWLGFTNIMFSVMTTENARFSIRNTVWNNMEHVISGFHHGVNEIFTLLGYYTALIGSYRCFGTTFRPHLRGSGSLRRLLDPWRSDQWIVLKCLCN